MRNRIALICISLRAGGTERIVSRVANHLAKCHDVTVILLSRSKVFYAVDTPITILQPSLLPRSRVGPFWYLAVARYLWRSLVKHRPDVILCFGEAIAPAIIVLARLRAIKVLVFNRASPLSSLRGIRGIVNPLIYPLSERVVVQTQRSSEIMRKRYLLSRFGVAPNPIDLPPTVRPIEERNSDIINVGSLGGKKNQIALIRIFSRIHRKDGWRLIFIGDGPDLASLERSVKHLGMADSVCFMGQRSDVSKLYQRGRIFAFTSLTEGFPNSLAEAMAAGCACISYNCPTGPSDLIDHGSNGFLVTPGDEAGYSQLLQQLIDDADLREQFSRNARKSMVRFESRFVMRKLDKLIDETIGRPEPQYPSVKRKDTGSKDEGKH